MEAVNKVFEFLQNAGTFYLATVEGDQPRVRPYGAMMIFEGKIYIMAFGKTNATLQIAANPKAEICAFKGQTLRIECKLTEDSRPETQKALIEKMPVLKPALGENGENGVMYYLSDATATFFKMMEPVETVKF
ncbi:MAG: pyridoxamine 5'-phosphate oxidase family protein [Bacteroidales bacterium]|nr:pyridoxamine 5'-phosphate oxidase family protein [Bacteroidales bacterium]MBQ9174245.1 pyridoxamine 5'-phosphate oxidase family protein [Bacteroidales bacterium]MBQ9711628.1 pyridoxamine 5'-phosphate oxidase family protein [Bacteroidales bacterium]